MFWIYYTVSFNFADLNPFWQKSEPTFQHNNIYWATKQILLILVTFENTT